MYPRPNFGRGRLLFGKYDRPEGAGMRRAMNGIGKRWIRTKKRPPIEDRSRCGGRCDAGDDDDVVVVVVLLLLLCAVVGSWCSSCEMCNDFFIFKLLIGRSGSNGFFDPSFIFQLDLKDKMKQKTKLFSKVIDIKTINEAQFVTNLMTGLSDIIGSIFRTCAHYL